MKTTANLSRRELILAGCMSLAGIAALGLPRTALASNGYFPENEGLDDVQINARSLELFNRYEVGDSLSPSDADFVERYGMVPNVREAESVYNSQYYNGATYSLSGNRYYTNHYDGTYSYGATVQGGSGQAVCKSIYVGLYIMVYGYNNGDYGVIYKKSHGNTGYNRNFYTSQFSGNFSGLFVSGTMACSTTIVAPDGQTLSIGE